MCIVYPLNMKLDSYIFRVSACSRRDCKNATAFFTSSPLGGVPGSSSISWRGRIQYRGPRVPPFFGSIITTVAQSRFVSVAHDRYLGLALHFTPDTVLVSK